MTDEPVPRPLVLLGEEFRRMCREVDTRMDAAPFKSAPLFDICELLDEHLPLLSEHVTGFGEEINEGLGHLTHEPDSYFRRIARRMNAHLDAILDGYDDVRSLDSNAEDYTGWSLLVEIYEETLFQIHLWLDEVVDFVDDPVTFLKQRGVPPGGTLNLSLQMEAPPQVDRLTQWLNRRGYVLQAAQEEEYGKALQRSHTQGLVAGTLLGWWLGSR